MSFSAPRARRLAAIVAGPVAVALAALLIASCGGNGRSPVEVRLKKETAKRTVLGFPALATKNTTRVGGSDPVADAAGAADAVFPGHEADLRPRLVSLVNSDDWRTGVAASVLMAPPVNAPVLLAGKDGIPDPTSQALDTLAPRGLSSAGGAQVVAIEVHEVVVLDTSRRFEPVQHVPDGLRHTAGSEVPGVQPQLWRALEDRPGNRVPAHIPLQCPHLLIDSGVRHAAILRIGRRRAPPTCGGPRRVLRSIQA